MDRKIIFEIQKIKVLDVYAFKKIYFEWIYGEKLCYRILKTGLK